ncbi:class I SAM-dependent methyltransferase [Hyphomonas sp.]|uniref:class I SAM-dependent methyltransferase n=1 Tax=Hyphomonas sp. TaxID=87 RepID=UPI003D294A3B
MIKRADLLADITTYYAGKLAEHGNTPRGVDWNGLDSQQLRFKQLCQLIAPNAPYSIADFGCGYGALYEHLNSRGDTFEYVGIDASEEMIDSARKRLTANSNAVFVVDCNITQPFDYVVASGVFNVHVGRSSEEWVEYVEDTLEMMFSQAKLGVAFNCLTSYSDKDKMRPDLYYADPLYLFDLCKQRYSPHVALLHDYGLYEFTILVRK